MSGFIAIINTDGAPVDRTLLEGLTSSLATRGPDRQQVWTDGVAGLGHSLFATTDEARHENQPASLDGKTWICGCIRIDARNELLHKLGLQREIRLADIPDSHLVLHAYRAWGERCLDQLLGDFSFSLWDSPQRKLLCARDRFGLRQLCYARTNRTLIVSNSIDCLRKHPAVSDRLCNEAIGDFLLFGDHRWGDRSLTAFADIRTVPPAHCLVLQDTRINIRRYWDIAIDMPLLRYRDESEYLEHFGHVFNDAVSDRLRGNTAVISLSGGMDSASIAAMIVARPDTLDPSPGLDAVTVLHDSIHPSDERYYAELVSRHLELSSQHIDGGSYPLLNPYIQTTCPLELYQPKLWLDMEKYEPARGRVMLTGDGGDEVFAFSSARKALDDVGALEVLASVVQLRRLYASTPTLGTGLMALKDRLLDRSGTATLPYPYPQWINPDFEREFNLKQRWSLYWSQWRSKPASGLPRHPQIARAMLTPDWNNDDIYMNSGCTLMEQRCPFLDPRLVDLMMSLPALPWLFNKHLLRRYMANRLPQEILARAKTLLGALHVSMLTDNRLEKFQPAAMTALYIDQRWMDTLPTGAGSVAESYVNLRPTLLNRWLAALCA